MFFCLVNSANGTLQQPHTTGMSFRIYTFYPQSWTKTKGGKGGFALGRKDVFEITKGG